MLQPGIYLSNTCYHSAWAYLISSTNPSETTIHPIWALRVLPSFCLLALILPQTQFAHNPVWHDALIGFVTGLLIAQVIIGFSAKALVM